MVRVVVVPIFFFVSFDGVPDFVIVFVGRRTNGGVAVEGDATFQRRRSGGIGRRKGGLLAEEGHSMSAVLLATILLLLDPLLSFLVLLNRRGGQAQKLEVASLQVVVATAADATPPAGASASKQKIHRTTRTSFHLHQGCHDAIYDRK